MTPNVFLVDHSVRSSGQSERFCEVAERSEMLRAISTTVSQTPPPAIPAGSPLHWPLAYTSSPLLLRENHRKQNPQLSKWLSFRVLELSLHFHDSRLTQARCPATDDRRARISKGGGLTEQKSFYTLDALIEAFSVLNYQASATQTTRRRILWRIHRKQR